MVRVHVKKMRRHIFFLFHRTRSFSFFPPNYPDAPSSHPRRMDILPHRFVEYGVSKESMAYFSPALVVLGIIICTADSAPKQKNKLDPPVVDLPDIVAPRRRLVAERGIGAAL